MGFLIFQAKATTMKKSKLILIISIILSSCQYDKGIDFKGGYNYTVTPTDLNSSDSSATSLDSFKINETDNIVQPVFKENMNCNYSGRYYYDYII